MISLPHSHLALLVVFAWGCSSSGEAAQGAPSGDAGGAPGAGGRTGAGGRAGTGGAGTGGSLDAGGDDEGADAARSCTCAYVPPATTGWVDRCKKYPAFPDPSC